MELLLEQARTVGSTAWSSMRNKTIAFAITVLAVVLWPVWVYYLSKDIFNGERNRVCNTLQEYIEEWAEEYERLKQ